MSHKKQDDFDGYRKWLGITTKNSVPTHYELLAISLDEDDPDVIQGAAEQRRNYVESKKGLGHDDLVTEIVYRINEAESTLLNTALRRDYDRKLNLFAKRQKSRQYDPSVSRSRFRSRSGRTVGEDGGIVPTFAKIMAVVCVGFGIMAWLSFGMWNKPSKIDPVAAQPIVAESVPQQGQQAVQSPSAVAPVEPEPAKVLEPEAPKDGSAEIMKTATDFNGHHYKVFLEKLSWKQAKARCEEMKGHLATIGDKEEDTFVRSLADKATENITNTGVWLGGTDEGKEGQWEWADGSPFKYSDWFEGQPNNGSGLEHYLLLLLKFRGPAGKEFRGWCDQQNESKAHVTYFVCEWDSSEKKPAASTPAEGGPSVTPDPHVVLKGHTKRVSHIAMTADGKFLASTGDDKTVRLWSIDTAEQLWSVDWKKPTTALAFEADGKRLWVASEDGTHSVDARSGAIESELDFKCYGTAAFGKNCTLVATSNRGNLRVFNTKQQKQIRSHGAWTPRVAFNKDASLVIFGGNEGGEKDAAIHIYRTSDDKRIGEFTGLRDRTFALAVSPDDKYVAAASGVAKPDQKPEQNRIIVWDAATGRKVFDKSVQEGWCSSLAFSPDGKLIAGGGCGRDPDWSGHSLPDRNTIRVWRISDGKLLNNYSGHTAVVEDLAFTPDGQKIVSCGNDATIRIWSIDPSTSSVERDVAVWVLETGGKIEIETDSDERIGITAKADLPDREFTLHSIDLMNLKGVTDGDMPRFTGLRKLSKLTVMGTSVTDAGLRELADLKTLNSLNVAGTKITGAGFQYLSQLLSLEILLCGGAPISDSSLIFLKPLPKLRVLGLIDTQVTDAGIPSLKALAALTELRLVGTNITDRSVNHFKSLKNLEKLSLERTNVSKKGAAAIRAALPKCEVTD